MADRERKSWRDKDRQKDKSAHRRDEAPARGPAAARVESATAAYKRTLDAFFDQGVVPAHLKDKLPVAPEGDGQPDARQLAIRAVRAAASGPELVKAIDALRTKHGLPDDLELLVRVLEHPQDPVLNEALDLIGPHVENGDKLPNKKVLVERLKGLEFSSFDPRVQRKAAALVGKLR